jgi:ubiquitin-protein ligase
MTTNPRADSQDALPLSRPERLQADYRALTSLDKASSVLELSVDDPQNPDRYQLIFHGKGPVRGGRVHTQIELMERHEIEIRLPYRYPETEPDIRWETSIFHPNISNSGVVALGDLGLDWVPEMSLEAICERLWDTARLAYFDTDSPANRTAAEWINGKLPWPVPVDKRPLRDRGVPAGDNIVRYRRRSDAPPIDVTEADILYIPDGPSGKSNRENAPPRANPTPPDDITFLE